MRRHGRFPAIPHAPSQPNRARRARAAFTLTEILVASALTVAVIAMAAGSAYLFSTLAHTAPVGPARAASDSQLHAMLAELRNAVGIAHISPNEVVAAVTSNATVGTTPATGGAPTGAYLVAYYYGPSTHLLWRNGGPTASGTPSQFTPGLGTSGWSSPPARPAVGVPGPPPNKPSCASPCYNPSGAYLHHYYVSSSGCIGGFGNSQCVSWSGGVPASIPSSEAFWHTGSPIGRGYGRVCALGAITANGRYYALGSNSTYPTPYSGVCDATWNGPVLNGGQFALRSVGYVPAGCRGTANGGWTICWGNHYVISIEYKPASKTAYYYLPSCGCYLGQNQYNADVSNWNNYQNALNTYNQQYAAWQGAVNQWTAYGQSYGSYTKGVYSANSGATAWLSALHTESPSTRFTLSAGSWPAGTAWRIVADDIQSLTFTGYDQNMQPTTGPAAVYSLGITVQYPGQPAQQEVLSLYGGRQQQITATKPLVIPPKPPGQPKPCGSCGTGAQKVYQGYTPPPDPCPQQSGPWGVGWPKSAGRRLPLSLGPIHPITLAFPYDARACSGSIGWGRGFSGNGGGKGHIAGPFGSSISATVGRGGGYYGGIGPAGNGPFGW